MPKFKFSLAFLIALLAGALLPAWGQQLSTSQVPKVESHRVCPHPSSPHTMACHAWVVTSSLAGYRKASGAVGGAAAPAGYGPADLQSAYNLASLSSTAGTGRTIAIIDPFDDPNAEADLAVYRSTFGLPPCTSASGCFQKVNQLGATTPLPTADGGWSEEISLDLDVASAICPNCNLLLVEANTATDSDLGTAVNTAAGWPGIAAISISYGGEESSIDLTVNCPTYYNHAGVAITASSGDDGYPAPFGVNSPAACNQVTAVGGTSLMPATNSRGWSETVWFVNDSEGTGSGCSIYLPKPSWQMDSGCANRTVGDVSAVADPGTGVAAYDTYPNPDEINGWTVFGGTSVSAPLIAGVYALATPPASTDYPTSYAYSNPSAFNDVTTGYNSDKCKSYLCEAEVGYDGPTGWGTPNGVGGFEAGDSYNFSISASPSNLIVQQGTSGTSTISTAIISGGAGTVSLSVSGIPSGATASLSPASISSGSSSALTFNAGTAATGVYTLTVTGTGTTVTRSTSVTVSITAALINDFSISASPSTLNLVQNTSGTSTISTAITLGSAESVSLTVSGVPAGATATINPALINSGSSATLTVNAGTAALGTYSLLITGTAVGVYNTHTTTVSLVVTAPTPDFTITASPSSLTVGHPSIGIFSFKVAALNGFAGKVNFTVSGFPSKIAGGFLPASITGSGTSYLVFVVGPKQSTGTFPLTITGTSGSIQHTSNVTLIVH
jgi:subtilase family serine protease